MLDITTSNASARTPEIRIDKPHVYILPTLDRTRYKIGRSDNPLSRIAELKRVYRDIDLARAVVIEVDSDSIEGVLHGAFAPFRLRLPDEVDGRTEWFAGDNVDEVVELCQHLARHRRAEYKVVRGLPPLPKTKEEELSVRRRRRRLLSANPAIVARVAESQAGIFLQTLNERKFDEMVIRGGHHFLVRTVERENEPECWAVRSHSDASHWGWKLVRAAQVQVSDAGVSFHAQFISTPGFVARDSSVGRESFRLDRCVAMALADSDELSSPIASACALIGKALANLPRRIDDRPFKKEPWEGFRKHLH